MMLTILKLYLHDTSSKIPNQKLLTVKIDERLVKALKQLLLNRELFTTLAWFLSNKPMETAFWLLYPFQSQTMLQLEDWEFIEVLRQRLLIPIDKLDQDYCRECACKKVLFLGKDNHHFMICQVIHVATELPVTIEFVNNGIFYIENSTQKQLLKNNSLWSHKYQVEQEEKQMFHIMELGMLIQFIMI